MQLEDIQGRVLAGVLVVGADRVHRVSPDSTKAFAEGARPPDQLRGFGIRTRVTHVAPSPRRAGSITAAGVGRARRGRDLEKRSWSCAHRSEERRVGKACGSS